MIEYELNESYKKLINSIEAIFHDEIYSKLTTRIVKLEEPIIQKIDEVIGHTGAFFSDDFRITKREIKNIIEDSTNDFKKELVKLKEQIEGMLQSFYVSIQDIMKKEIPKDEKFRLLARHTDDLKINISSLNKKIDESLSFFDELVSYFKKNSGNDDYSYEMKQFLNQEKQQFKKKYVETIAYVIGDVVRKVNKDVDNLVVPYINKEQRAKEEKEAETEKVEQPKIDVKGKILFRIRDIVIPKIKNSKVVDTKEFVDYTHEVGLEYINNIINITGLENSNVNIMILRQNLLLNLMNQIENCEEVLNGFFQQYYNSLLSKISNMENDELTINNFLVDCYKDADEALRKLDYSSNYFNTETTKFINSAREFLNEEQIEKINKLSEDYKVNFNKAMYNVIDNLAKTNTEKIGDIKIIKQETEKEDTLVDSNVMNNGVQNQEIPNNESELKNDNPSIIEEKKQTEPIVVEESVESKTEVVEDKKQEQPKANNKKRGFTEGADQFIKGIEEITNQHIHFLKRHDLALKLHDISFMQVKEIDETSSKMLYAIAEMYQMKKETLVEDSNLLMENYSSFIESCLQKDYAKNVFEDVVKKIMNNNDNWLTFEQMDELTNLAEEYKNNFNLYMKNEIIAMQKETFEKANRHFGIVYPGNNEETLEENKGHKI